MVPVRVALAAGILLVLLPSAAGAQSQISDEQRAQLQTLRAEVAAQIQLQAYDLLDELVYGWTQQPPFGLDTPVVLAGVSVPVGFGSGMQALIESHFASIVVDNPKTRIQLSHCPQCTAMVVHSQQKATIVARGVDQPEVLAAAGALSSSKHALFLDFEAEGASLVLRARITSLEPALPIVYAKTLSTSTSSPALLRTGAHLKSAAEAHDEYIEAIKGLNSYIIPVRLGVRTYAQSGGGFAAVAVPPFVWIHAGVDGAFTRSRSWTGSLALGFSYTPELHTAYMVQGRLARLVSGTTTSLTHPDLYVFVGIEAVDIRGASALAFRERVPTPDEILATLTGRDPREAFAMWHIGLELRVKNRIATSFFLQSLPSKTDVDGLGEYLTVLGIPFQSIGAEVAFCF